MFLEEARSIPGHVERAVVNAHRAARGELGSLRIGYVPAVVHTGLPEIVRGFRKRFPHVDVRPQIAQEGSFTDVLSLVASGAGVAIIPTSLRGIRRAGVLFRPLREGPMTQLDMVWRKDAASPVLREFLEQVRRLGARGIRLRK